MVACHVSGIMFVMLNSLWPDSGSGRLLENCKYEIPNNNIVTNTTLGIFYLLSLPYMEEMNAKFLLYTTADQVNVTVNTSIEAIPLQATVVVTRKNITVFVVDKIHQYQRISLIYWTFKVMAEKEFGVTVLLTSAKSAESFLVAPVASWGRSYYVITLSGQPFFHVVAAKFTTVTIKLRLHHNQILRVGSETRRNGETYYLTLHCEEAYVFDLCRDKKKFESFNGTSIQSVHDIGVLAGNCKANLLSGVCPSNNSNGQADVLVEMLSPEEVFGNIFIVFTLPDTTLELNVYITASQRDTLITYYDNYGRQKMLLLPQPGITTNLYPSKRSFYMTSDKGIQVTMFKGSTCNTDTGSPAMCTLVPNELFLSNYVISASGEFSANYVIVVSRTHIGDYFTLDGDKTFIRNCIWLPVYGHANLTTGHCKVPAGVYKISNEKMNFGCYMYGLNTHTSYLHAAGYNTAHINYKCNISIIDTKPGDRIDNDCDEEIDEETANGKDDDDDGLTDEDIKDKIIPVNGSWGEWGEFYCPSICLNDTFVRRRSCDNPEPAKGGLPCEGASIESNKTICKGTEKLCPYECKTGSYGVGCYGNCQNCEDDCNKTIGACQRCKLGYAGQETGCTKTCPPLTYGFSCKGSCLEKCNDECLDTIYGDCPQTSRLLNILLFLLLVPPFFLFYICIRRCKRKPVVPRMIVIKSEPASTSVDDDRSIRFLNPKKMLRRMRSNTSEVTTITVDTEATTTTRSEGTELN